MADGSARFRAAPRRCHHAAVQRVGAFRHSISDGRHRHASKLAGSQVAKADVKVRDILIAGMGDSFASGEGNPDLAVRFSRERSADYSTVGIYSG